MGRVLGYGEFWFCLPFLVDLLRRWRHSKHSARVRSIPLLLYWQAPARVLPCSAQEPSALRDRAVDVVRVGPHVMLSACAAALGEAL